MRPRGRDPERRRPLDLGSGGARGRRGRLRRGAACRRVRMVSRAYHDCVFMARDLPDGDDLRALGGAASATGPTSTRRPRRSPRARGSWPAPCGGWRPERLLLGVLAPGRAAAARASRRYTWWIVALARGVAVQHHPDAHAAASPAPGSRWRTGAGLLVRPASRAATAGNSAVRSGVDGEDDRDQVVDREPVAADHLGEQLGGALEDRLRRCPPTPRSPPGPP